MSVEADPTHPGFDAAPGDLRARAASRLAVEAWARAQTGHPVALFDTVAYLQTDRLDVLALTGDRLPLGPLSIRLTLAEPGFQRWLGLESPIRFGPGAIRAGDAVIQADGMAVWDPRPPWAALSENPLSLVRAMPLIVDAVRQDAPPGSLAVLLTGLGSPPAAGAIESLVVAQAARCAVDFEDALGAFLRSGDLALVRSAATRLAGLGGGFTPAGDDYLMGAMVAMRSMLPPDRAWTISNAIAEAAAPGTSTVSAAYLRAAAEGAAGEAWHSLLEAILTGDFDAVRQAVAALCAIGHTSGADALAGFLLTLRALRPA